MKHHDQEIANMLHNVEYYIKSLEETNDHFSTQIGNLTEFLVTYNTNPLNLGRYSTDVAIDEIKRLSDENEQLKKELIKVKMRGM
jgi:hypothetical protein